MVPEALFDLLGTDVRCVAILHGHNELGGLARIGDLVSLSRKAAPDAHIHVDLVQAFGKVAFDLDAEDVDSVAVSAHKLHGPRGVGCLAYNNTARIAPLKEGGGQEHGLRGGTENVAGAVGLAVATEHALTHLAEHALHMEGLLIELMEQICKHIPTAHRLGTDDRRLPHVLSLRLPGINGASLQQLASERGLAFSTGSACHTDTESSSPVLSAAGLSRREAREVVRLSVSPLTTTEDIAAATDVLATEIAALAKIGSGL